MTQLTNAELAAQLSEVAAGWQAFLTDQLAWLHSTADEVTFTDPVTGNTLTVQTFYKITSDYEGILGDNPERIEQIEQLLTDSQTLLGDLQNLEASFSTQETVISGYQVAAEAARDAAQTAESNAASSASAAAASATDAGTSESNAAASATDAADAESAAQQAQGIAEAARDAASGFASDASGHASTAQNWAELPEDVEVEPGQFSAKHWAQKASQVSSGITDSDDIPEGSANLFFTDARAVDAIKADSSWAAGNWDAAYSWGDHAAAGYLTSESDPTVPAHVKAITAAQVGNWDTAFSWGDHAAAGYLTSVSETDVTQWEASLTISQSQVTGLASALAGKANSSHTHDASDIVSGTINVNRIPNLSATKITSGTLNVNRIPNLSATKITSGTLNSSRIPSLPTSKITGLDAQLLDKADEADTLEAEVRVVGGPTTSDLFLTGTFGQMTKSGFVMRCTNTVTRGVGLDNALPVGYQFTMVNTGDDQVDINPESGFTYTWLLSDDSITEPALEGRAGAMVTLVKTAFNEWMVTGNLVENSGTTGDGETTGS